MNKSIESISKEKQEELKKIVNYILEDTLYKNKKSVVQILLFGSYAKGKAVEQPDFQIQRDGTNTVYQSDFDILIILKKQKETKNHLSKKLIQENISKDNEIKTPVSILFESEKDLCNYLKDERYFYQEIIEEGITLWQRGKADIKNIAIKKITNLRKKELVNEDFQNYWNQVIENLIDYKNICNRENYKKASFELHQATENLFSCLLLVFIRYTPKEHNLETLLDKWIFKKIDKNITKEIQNIFPKNTEKEKHLFDLLKRSYIESRYYKDFSVNKEELELLHKKIQKLKVIVEKVCKEKIKGYF